MSDNKTFEDAWLLLDAHATANEVEAKNYRRKGRDEDADDLEREAKSYRAAIAFLKAGQKASTDRDNLMVELEYLINEAKAVSKEPVIKKRLMTVKELMEAEGLWEKRMKKITSLLAALPKGD